MNIEFTCKTNKKTVMINTLVITLPEGTKLTMDRDETEYTIDDNELKMTWENIYLYAINDCHFFSHRVDPGFYIYDEYAIEEFNQLVKDAEFSFELEDDAEEDYEVSLISHSDFF